MPPRRLDLRETRATAELRYERYLREVRELLTAADANAHRGQWAESANRLHAALEGVAAAAGVCRELNLIYTVMED